VEVEAEKRKADGRGVNFQGEDAEHESLGMSGEYEDDVLLENESRSQSDCNIAFSPRAETSSTPRPQGASGMNIKDMGMDSTSFANYVETAVRSLSQSGS